MRAVCWYGTEDVRVVNVEEPRIVNARDAIVRVRAMTICGSDLHIYDGYIPTMQKGDILGHEFMGEVVEVGPAVTNLKVGDRVIVPSVISCGHCFFCENTLWSLCDNSNPNAWLTRKAYGHAPAGIFGYSHAFGGYAGAQAEYVRVPFADVGPVVVPDELSDEQALFISDAFPTGFMGADLCNIQPGDVVAVWGCGAVGLFAMKSCYLLGARRVIAIDRNPARLAVARDFCDAIPLNYEEVDVVEALSELSGGRGPDACIDAVGLEAHGTDTLSAYDWVAQKVRLETDRPNVLRTMIQAVRKGGTLSIMGVYSGYLDKIPFGAAFNKGLTFRMGQMHAQRYLRRLVEYARTGEVDPAFVITHRMGIDDAPRAYKTFRDEQRECLRVVMRP
jgi:threonine dehydrogenase-like Zn-dependent dehydrogenase